MKTYNERECKSFDCNNWFVPTRGDQRYCSEICRHRQHQRMRNKNWIKYDTTQNGYRFGKSWEYLTPAEQKAILDQERAAIAAIKKQEAEEAFKRTLEDFKRILAAPSAQKENK